MSRIIVLGGGYAGLMAAERIGRKHQVTLVNGSAAPVRRASPRIGGSGGLSQGGPPLFIAAVPPGQAAG